MNYRHAYHAGNFADVFKHITLIALIQALLHKETAFCYLDTHAGIGIYDLLSAAAQKSKEFETGITKILSRQDAPELIQLYLSCIQKLNPTSAINLYPGSPYIAKHFLRQQDRMILSELHPDDYHVLKNHFSKDKQVAIHCQDAYQSLKAFLPPKERRGIVLIDPPYEKTDEFAQLIKAISAAVTRWETGIYALWYPIKVGAHLERFQHALKEKIKRPLLITELCIYPENTATGLNGCGMIIINPPWQLDQQLQTILPWLWDALSVNKQGRYHLITL